MRYILLIMALFGSEQLHARDCSALLDVNVKTLNKDRVLNLCKDGVIEKMFIEPDVPGDPFEVSDADTMLDYINVNADKPYVVSILTRPGCAFCARAKQVLSDQNIDYDEISLGTHTATRAVRAITGMQTVPQVFINGEHIGGVEDLEEYFSSVNIKQVA